MILNFQTIQIIAQLAVLIGEQIIPDIIKICHPEGSEQEHKDLAIQVDEEHKKIASELINQQLKI